MTRPDDVVFTTPVQHRDPHLRLLAQGVLRLVYTPREPYAMQLYILEGASGDYVRWVGSRGAFIHAAGRGVPFPGLDMVVTRVMGEDGKPALRITLHGSCPDWDSGDPDFSRHNGDVLHLDIALDHDLRTFLNRTTQVVPLGTEEQHLDLDRLISQLLRATF